MAGAITVTLPLSMERDVLDVAVAKKDLAVEAEME